MAFDTLNRTSSVHRGQPEASTRDRKTLALPPGGVEGRMRHILVIEDDPGVQDVLRDILEEDGFRVSVVADVASAREVLNCGDVVLIISDDALRQDNGLTITQEAFRRSTPRILMTASPDRQNEMREAGFDFMAKPFRLAELRRRIGVAIGRISEDFLSASIVGVVENKAAF
jgi:DNA-binding response OmpR family regulator